MRLGSPPVLRRSTLQPRSADAPADALSAVRDRARPADTTRASRTFGDLTRAGRSREDIPSQLAASRPRGLGLRSATRTAQCAYSASWADAQPMLRQRNPQAAGQLTALLRADAGPQGAPSCLQEAHHAREALCADGFAACPSWQELWDGVRPAQASPEPGEWRHDWQYHASAARERRHRDDAVCPYSHRRNSGCWTPKEDAAGDDTCA